MIPLIPKFKLNALSALVMLSLTAATTLAADKINVLVWDEQQQV